MPICIACKRDIKKLVIHHWFEPPNMVRHERLVCLGCNTMLIQKYFYTQKQIVDLFNTYSYDGYHIMPDWNTQEMYVLKQRYKLAKSILEPQTLKRLEYYRESPNETVDDLVKAVLNEVDKNVKDLEK